jgi:sugar/nucleoside kinase (ribokinase family)
VNVGNARLTAGGVVPNTGITLSRLGIQTRLAGRIGRDEFGSCIADIIKDENVEIDLKACDDEGTSYTVILNIPGEDRIFLHNPGTNNTFCADDISMDAVKDIDLSISVILRS